MGSQVTPLASRSPQDPESGYHISAHETTPGRTVFTEDSNTDGWIATDLTVDPSAFR